METQIVPFDAEANHRQSLLNKINDLVANMNLNRERLEQRIVRLRRSIPFGYYADVSSTKSADQ